MPQGESPAQWRRRQRDMLLERRLTAGAKQRQVWNTVIEASLRPLLPEKQDAVIAVYWPFNGEFGIRPLMRELHDRDRRPALPVVVEPRAPLEFRLWHPRAEMVREVYGIPVPKATQAVTPDVVVAPLVGFDAAGYRLGYGGGYYDRTLAAFAAKPLTIGVGFELSRLDTIHPQPHDVPMDMIVTESGVNDFG